MFMISLYKIANTEKLLKCLTFGCCHLLLVVHFKILDDLYIVRSIAIMSIAFVTQ